MTESEGARDAFAKMAFEGKALETWRNYWESSKPQRAANFLLQEYGGDAAKEAAFAALAALGDNEPAEYNYWVAVFEILRPTDAGPWTPLPVPVSRRDQ